MKEMINKCDLCGKTVPRNVKLMSFEMPAISHYRSIRTSLQDFFDTDSRYVDVCIGCLKMIRRLRKEEMEKELEEE